MGLLNIVLFYSLSKSQFSRKSVDDIITEQYRTVSTTVKDCLKDNGILMTNEQTKDAFPALERIFKECKSKKLSKKLNIRAQREHKMVRPDIVIRRTDKSKVFYIGKAADFERKAQEYMLKTEAYQEITSGRSPLTDSLRTVQTLLDYFVTKNVLTKKQRNQLCPKLDKLELGHYLGMPKPHKVNSYQTAYQC